jgi:ABC-type ATPase involved in cell division
MIEFEGVRIEDPRGGLVVGDVNFRVERAHAVVVEAAVGGGSSRIFHALLAETPVAAGTVTLFGHKVSRLRASALAAMRRRLGLVPQSVTLVDDEPVTVSVALPLLLVGAPRRTAELRALELLGTLSLAEKSSSRVADLSWQERQRVALARALVHEPAVILADQPTSLQDDAGAQLVLRALAQAVDAGACCLLLSRDPRVGAFARAHTWPRHELRDGAFLPAVDHAAVPNVVPFPVSARTAKAARAAKAG